MMTRIFRLTAAVPFALLLAGLAAPPAQAQISVWSATLTVDMDTRFVTLEWGCDDKAPVPDDCSTALTDNDFVFNGTTYTVKALYLLGNRLKGGGFTLWQVVLDFDRPTPTPTMTLHLDTAQLLTSDAQRTYASREVAGSITADERDRNARWNWYRRWWEGDSYWPDRGLSPWTDGQQVSVKLTMQGDSSTGAQPSTEELEPPDEEASEQQKQAAGSSLDLTGTNGPDELVGGDGNDVLIGKRGADVLRGRAGEDELRGGRGADHLHGGRGADRLWGGRGNDRLYGDRGADRLEGGNGDDTYSGGPGADRFVFLSSETGDKIITDFRDGDDRIVLKTDGEPWPPVADIIAGVAADGARYYVYTLLDGLTVETDTPLRAEHFQVK